MNNKGLLDDALAELGEISGADFQERLEITNTRAWIFSKQGLIVRARNLWETIVNEENCAKYTLNSAHVGLSTH